MVLLGNGVLVLVGAFIILLFVAVQLWIGVQLRHEIHEGEAANASHARWVAPWTSVQFAGIVMMGAHSSAPLSGHRKSSSE